MFDHGIKDEKGSISHADRYQASQPKTSRQALQGQRPRRPLRSSHAGRDNLF